MNNPDAYYQRSEVSNSDLTALKELLHPRPMFGDREAAFRFGSIVDAIITEPSRVDFLHATIDGEPVNEDEWLHAREMQRALRAEARRDQFLAKVLELADTQRFMVNKAQEFENGGFRFTLPTRCKWDWWLEAADSVETSRLQPAPRKRSLSRRWISLTGTGPRLVYGHSTK